jgi:hypothetical protein
MTELSPDAQEVLDGFQGVILDTSFADLMALAAALRALAKQSTFADTRVGVTEEVVLVDDILKIATELEQI